MQRQKLKTILFPVVVLILGLAGLVPAYARSQEFGHTTLIGQTDEAVVVLTLAAEPVRAGEQALTVVLRDLQGRPLAGQQVLVGAAPGALTAPGQPGAQPAQQPTTHSHAMGAMGQPGAPAASPPAALALTAQPGIYAGRIVFDRPGDWRLSVDVADGRATHRHIVDFGLRVAGPPPNWAVLGGFLVANVSVLSAAAVLKLKTPLKTAAIAAPLKVRP